MLERWEQVFKALGQETRLRIFLTLTQQEYCVCQLENAFNVSQSAISQHLRILREAGLVYAERKGQWVFYTANDDALRRLLGGFSDAMSSEPLPEIEGIREKAAEIELEGCSVRNND